MTAGHGRVVWLQEMTNTNVVKVVAIYIVAEGKIAMHMQPLAEMIFWLILRGSASDVAVAQDE
jgi:hypothetical protein